MLPNCPIGEQHAKASRIVGVVYVPPFLALLGCVACKLQASPDGFALFFTTFPYPVPLGALLSLPVATPPIASGVYPSGHLYDCRKYRNQPAILGLSQKSNKLACCWCQDVLSFDTQTRSYYNTNPNWQLGTVVNIANEWLSTFMKASATLLLCGW